MKILFCLVVFIFIFSFCCAEGSKVVNWKPWKNGIWIASSPSDFEFKSLFVGGERMIRARTPNHGNFFYFNRTLGWSNTMGFVYNGNDMNFSPATDIGALNVMTYHAWTVSRSYISQLFSENKTVIFTAPVNPILSYGGASGNRYFVENSLSFLDEESEWFADFENGMIYFFPPANMDPNTLEIVVPTNLSLLTLNGVSNKVFQNVVFEYSDYLCNPNMTCDGQSGTYTSAGVILKNCHNISFVNVTIKNTGGYGIHISEGSSNIVVKDSLIYGTGAGGIRIGDDSASVIPKNISIANNFILNGGGVNPAGCGLLIQRCEETFILHNSISNFSYTGISHGWDWQYADGVRTRNNVIAFNRINNIGSLLELSDLGGIYTLGETENTTVNNNWVKLLFDI